MRRLHAGLEGLGKEVWVDLEDIPPSVDWFERIKAGIGEANSFVFVISPDSVASEICAREVAHAAALNKRVIPVLRRQVDPRALPAAVGRRNWVECQDDVAFEAALALLAETLATDFAWVEAHTRWQNAAMRWDAADRGPSLLLRGTELASAEAWLGRAAAEQKEPAPTALHYEYILAGRKQASRRQRMTVAAVSIALVATLGLAVVALILRAQANEERRAAVSRELSANAFLTLRRTRRSACCWRGGPRASTPTVRRGTPFASRLRSPGCASRPDRTETTSRAQI